ncbi:MAG: hypothetical protein KAU31_17280, partial [Spirochaetaceae bacterium]|nr:hypothetical protein [Spirochaetaceae bacterium]
DIPAHIVTALEGAGVDYIEDLVSMTDDELSAIEALTPEDVELLKKTIAENVEIIENEEFADDDAEGMEEETEAAATPDEAEPPPDGTEPVPADQRTADTETQEAVVSDNKDDEAPAGEEESAEETLQGIEDQPEDEEDEEVETEITLISELPEISDSVVQILKDHGIVDIVDLLDMPENQLRKMEGITEEDVTAIQAIISDNVDIIEEDEDNGDAD